MNRLLFSLLLMPLASCALPTDGALQSRIAATCVVAGWTPGTDEHEECVGYVASGRNGLSSATLQSRAEEFSRRYLARARYSGAGHCCPGAPDGA